VRIAEALKWMKALKFSGFIAFSVSAIRMRGGQHARGTASGIAYPGRSISGERSEEGRLAGNRLIADS
jgi:hypothetical protein